MSIQPLRGEISIPGDKSISHRGIMLGSLAKGDTIIEHFLEGADCLSTIGCFRAMGIDIEREGQRVLVRGKGLRGLQRPSATLDVGNSGTTMRLMSGILAPQEFDCHITGDASIQRRPMKRIITPLTQMGADIASIPGNGCAPLAINGKRLHSISYNSPVASAQVKSAILLAGLYAEGDTSVTEPYISRDHTEIMLGHFGGKIRREGTTAIVSPVEELYASDITVPGDISSAAYFLAAASIVPDSELVLKNVGINPTRDGILRVMKLMGASFHLENEQLRGGEPTADIIVKYSHLHGTEIGGELIPTLIDEIPVIAIMAAVAEGTTVIKDAGELRVKESDRIAVMTDNLKALGVDATATEDGMIINGGRRLCGGTIDSHMDHRIAMSFAVAGLCCEETVDILGRECVDISYPGFYEDLKNSQG